MIILGVDGTLKKGDYAENIQTAMAFWLKILGENAELAAWFVTEIKNSTYKGETIAGQSYKVGDMTLPRLGQFLNEVAASAESLKGCRQG